MSRFFIGMPVFNGEAYISEALDSIIRQSFCDWQLLMADNCSTDGTEIKLIERYVSRDPRIKYGRHSSNIGAVNNFFLIITPAIKHVNLMRHKQPLDD